MPYHDRPIGSAHAEILFWANHEFSHNYVALERHYGAESKTKKPQMGTDEH